jgi:hypothetical protein
MEKKVGITTREGKVSGGIIHNAPGGAGRDKADFLRFRHGRDRNLGFKFTNYVQPSPLLFNRDALPIFLGDMYKGSSCFLVAGGPSFADVDKEKMARPGVLSMGINNAVKSFRTNMWISVDNPQNFMKSIWMDPKMMKFCPLAHSEKNIFDNETWKESNIKVGDCPNVFYYRRNEKFIADNFLIEDSINWGDHSKWGGGRSVMLPAIRILFFLGIRTIYLLGVDFNMDKDTKYHFDQDRSPSSIKGNNGTYNKLKKRFTQLKPIFEENDLYIYNCNPDSRLKVFDFVDFDKAVKVTTELLPDDFSKERSSGMYDKNSKKKEADKAKMLEQKRLKQEQREGKTKPKENIKPQIDQKEIKNKVKKELDIARKNLDLAKQSVEEFKQNMNSMETVGDDITNMLQRLDRDVVEKRAIFKKKEKKKNIIWYGTKESPKK